MTPMRRLLPFCLAAALSLTAVPTLPAPAFAQTAECGGRDLLAAMKKDEPARHAAIMAAAGRIENGNSVFWKIVPPNGAAPSWLLGTMHLSDPRVLDLPAPARKALGGARVVALENTNVLDPASARSAYASGLSHMVYGDGRTLRTVLDDATWTAVKTAVEGRGIPGWAVMGWKPWMLTFGLLIYPGCELKRWTEGKDFLDIAIGKTAKAAGKPVVDLETVQDQFSAIDAMTEAEQIAMLKVIAAADGRMVDMQETMLRAYEAGRVDILWATSLDLLGGADGFAESLLRNASYRRNHIMSGNARPLIDGGNAFLAIGALHLVGPEGVVALLRKAGYTVTAVR
jgi:uncharacterized protein YbaP (TraB family)